MSTECGRVEPDGGGVWSVRHLRTESLDESEVINEVIAAGWTPWSPI